MTMYLELLRAALDAWDAPPAGDRLVALARAQRQLLAREGDAGITPSRSLATQIAYDRALLRLGAERGVAFDPETFRHPESARRHLESVLAGTGVELVPPVSGGAVLRP